jgi:hypothetical protein
MAFVWVPLVRCCLHLLTMRGVFSRSMRMCAQVRGAVVKHWRATARQHEHWPKQVNEDAIRALLSMFAGDAPSVQPQHAHVATPPCVLQTEVTYTHLSNIIAIPIICC